MDDNDLLVFEAWANPRIDAYDQAPDGTYSRLAWLPIIGPSSWLVWGTLAAQLRLQAEVRWQLDALAEAHGLHRSPARNGAVRKTLARLAQFRLVSPVDDHHHLVRLSAPPLSRRQLDRLPEFVAELQHQAFSQDPHRKVG